MQPQDNNTPPTKSKNQSAADAITPSGESPVGTPMAAAEAYAASPTTRTPTTAEAERARLGAVLVSTSSNNDEDASAANEASRLMRSELVLLLEQATALKDQRLHLEQRRKEMTDAVLDSVDRLLPPAQWMQTTPLGQRPSVLAAAQTTTTTTPGVSEQQRRQQQQNYDAHALSSSCSSRREEASELLYAALNAQKALHRLKLSCRQQQQQQALAAGSPPASSLAGGGAPSTSAATGPQRPPPATATITSKAKELIDARALTEKHTLELTVLSQRESLLQHRANALLKEKGNEVQRRDDLMKRRVELRKSVAAATATATSSYAASAATGATGTIEALTARRDALLAEWERLRGAASVRQQQPSSLSSPPFNTRASSINNSSNNRSPLPWSSSPSAQQRSSTSHNVTDDAIGVAAQRWILPEQYLVRSLN